MSLPYTLNKKDGRLVIHDGVEVISADLLNKSLRRHVQELVLGEDVVTIEANTFQGWPMLRKVHGNDALEDIAPAGSYAAEWFRTYTLT